MTEIMLPVRPKWCELIASGKKTIEARKFCPKCDVPFKVYIYETKAPSDMPTFIDEDGHVVYTGRGEVIGEFVCYKCYSIHIPTDIQFAIDTGLWSPFSERFLRDTCLTPEEVIDYAGDREYIFGWTISDLIIYDKPKQLSEFYVEDTEAIKNCKHRFRWAQPESVTQHGGWIKGGYSCMKNGEPEWCEKCLKKPLVRPPQSWCYVERRDEK